MDLKEMYEKVLGLKSVKRTGWVQKQIPGPESVADHTFGVSFLALTIDLPEGVDRDKLLKMAVIHDVAEVEIGDQVLENGKKADEEKIREKHLEESKFSSKLFSNKKELNDLFQEFIEQRTKTSKFLKELDKLEMAFQASKYREHGKDLAEFFENAEKYIESQQVKEIFEEIRKSN